EEKIDPTSGPVLDLAAQDPIAGELGDSAVLNRFGDERIGARGVYVDARAGTFGHFPGVEELAPRARFAQPGAGPGIETGLPRASVGAMGGDSLAVIERYVDEAALITTNDRSLDKGAAKKP